MQTQERRPECACGRGAGALSFSGSGASSCGSGSGGVSPASGAPRMLEDSEPTSRRWAWDHLLQRIHHLLARHHLASSWLVPDCGCGCVKAEELVPKEQGRPASSASFSSYPDRQNPPDAGGRHKSREQSKQGVSPLWPPASPAPAVPPSPFALGAVSPGLEPSAKLLAASECN